MKKRWKRKGGKVITAVDDWQAPPRYRKLDDVREALEIWASGPAGGHEPIGEVAQRVVAQSAAEDES